jgi:magnesium transporter
MRKLSESAGTGRSGRYQRKLALFEGFGSDGPVSAAAAASATPETQMKRAPDSKTPLLGRTRSGRAVHADFGTHTGHAQFPAGGVRRESAAGTANEKERPFRFSFYSNALPSTIHARSLSEIPADGQTFEDLFVGSKNLSERHEWDEGMSEGGEKTGGATTPTGINGSASGAPLKSGGLRSAMRTDEDTEDNTWWLDVLCPTDAEMRTFSKVGLSPRPPDDAC